jgi:hypothetical protein
MSIKNRGYPRRQARQARQASSLHFHCHPSVLFSEGRIVMRYNDDVTVSWPVKTDFRRPNTLS